MNIFMSDLTSEEIIEKLNKIDDFSVDEDGNLLFRGEPVTTKKDNTLTDDDIQVAINDTLHTLNLDTMITETIDMLNSDEPLEIDPEIQEAISDAIKLLNQ